jgi:hypothetical protein
MTNRQSKHAGQTVHEAVVKALEAWVDRHPTPDAPALSIAVSGQFTPRQLLCEVRDRSDTGLQLEEMIETAVANKSCTLDEVLSLFGGPEPGRSAQPQVRNSL